MSSARNRELGALVPVALLLTAGFAAVFAQETRRRLGNLSLIYGAYFLAVCLATHIYLRIRLPNADPYLFPLVALLTAFGLVMIYRIDANLARDQANWFVFGLVLFALTIQFLRDYDVLERYRYTIAAVGLLLLLAPRLPGIGQQVNGAYLGVKLGPLAFQPAEFSKICHRHLPRQLPARAPRGADRRRPAGPRGDPAAAQAPRAAAGRLGRLDVHARLHPRPGQLADVLRRLPGAALRRDRALLVRRHRDGAVRPRRLVLRLARAPRPRPGRDLARPLPGPAPASTTRAERVPDPAVDLRPGRRRAVRQRLRPGADHDPRHHTTALLPAAQTDTIYSLIVNELGLFGACGLILVYLLVAARGFKIALLADDGFSKLLATGLTAVFAIQAFVIIGGVTRVIPLTGVTLPFVSYGGSSIVANFVLLALLLLISDRARREARAGGRGIVNRQIVKLFAFIVVLFAVLVGFTSYWSVFDAKALKEKDANKRPLLEQQQIRRGRILAADGTVIARSVPKGHGASAALRPPLSGRRALRAPDRVQLRANRGTPSSSSSTTTSWSATNPNSARSSTNCAARSRKATTSSPTSTPKRSGSRSPGSKRRASARSSRSNRAAAGSG